MLHWLRSFGSYTVAPTPYGLLGLKWLFCMENVSGVSLLPRLLGAGEGC